MLHSVHPSTWTNSANRDLHVLHLINQPEATSGVTNWFLEHERLQRRSGDFRVHRIWWKVFFWTPSIHLSSMKVVRSLRWAERRLQVAKSQNGNHNQALFPKSNICQAHAMQQGFPQAIPIASLHFTRKLMPTPCSVRWLGTMSAGSFSWRRLHIPWGDKKKSRESKLPEVSAHLRCAITHWYTAASRN